MSGAITIVRERPARLKLGFFTLFALLLSVVSLNFSGRPASAGAAPRLSMPATLPGDSTIGPAGGSQETPQIAAGGSGYLVVWEDSRTNYLNYPGNALQSGGEPGGQSLKDIYAARLDANGNLIDTIPIVVAQATWDQTRPQVAWNGQNWLVVWNTQRVANFTSTIDVHAKRVSPQGAVLDINPILVDTNPTIDELWPVVASDGSNWVVMWMDQGDYFELDAARVGPDGTVLDPGGVPLHTPSFPDAPYNVRLTFAAGEFFAVWSGDNRIKGLRFTPSLQQIGSAFLVSVQGAGNFPDVTSNGTDYFVDWQQNNGVFGARVAHNGQVLDPAGIDIAGSHGGYPYPEIVWDGTQWIATWVGTTDNAYAARISTAGSVLDPNGIMVSPNAVISAIVGQPNGGARIVWTDIHNGLGYYDIYGASLGADGIVGPSSPVSEGAPSQYRVDVAPNGTGYLAVFISEVSGDTRVKGQRLDANGNAIDAEPFLIAGGSPLLRTPRVAWNGTLYLVVWEQSSGIFGKRVAADGSVLDPTPISIMPGNQPDVDAVGSTFLVVDSHEPVNHIRYIKAVRVASDGSVQGGPVIIGSSYGLQPKVAAFGNRWLAIWHRQPTHDNSRSSAFAAFVEQDGTTSGDFFVAGDGILPVRSTFLATGPTQGLLIYFKVRQGDATDGDLYARRILPDGTLLDGNPGIQITTAANAQFLPSAAWDGSEYVIAYEDYRAVAYLDRPISDIYGTRVDSSGAVLDPNGFVISNDFIPEVAPAVAALNSSYLIAYSEFKYAAPYSAYRIEVQQGQAGGPPTPQPTRTPTVPPTPTQPVCVPDNFAVAQSTGQSIVPGTLDTGSQCDECAVMINIPFGFHLYDRTFNTVLATANGTLNFVDSGRTGGINFCLPYSGLGYSILPYWDDLTTENPGHGIFTSVSGSAPNRIFNIEWRAQYYPQGADVNFEARLYENAADQRFDIIYGQLNGNGSGATVGVQKDTGTRYTEFECNMGGLSQGLMLTFTIQQCNTGTPTFTPTATPNVTNTPIPTGSATAMATSTLPAGTATAVASSTPMATSTPTATATICAIMFTDVQATDYFYEAVRYLYCAGDISGYADNTFRPYNNTTRGQLAKIVVNAEGWPIDTTGGPHFSDVYGNDAFYAFIETAYNHGIISGYADGTFRPGSNVTRAQLAKIVVSAEGWPINNPSQPHFSDVVEGDPFFGYIETAYSHNLISGYSDGTFRPGNNATRGQISKIVYSAITQP